MPLPSHTTDRLIGYLPHAKLLVYKGSWREAQPRRIRATILNCFLKVRSADDSLCTHYSLYGQSHQLEDQQSCRFPGAITLTTAAEAMGQERRT